MAGNMYGYIRVSSRDQHTDRQRMALIRYGIPVENLFTDKQSGKDFERPQYKKLLRILKPTDCMVVTSLDRLGRNYSEILEQWHNITKRKNADIVVLDMPLLNTRLSHDNLTGRFLSDIVLQILSYVAETERHNIRKRQAEGIAAAKAKGVRIGRPKRDLPENFHKIALMIQNKEITYRQGAKKLGVSHSWLYQAVASQKQEVNF
ncbi:MAG: recombinase family protein [Acidaminococcaceae bacterium]|nr:recombinase family protein [Acidaminococcaceae bacterium]